MELSASTAQPKSNAQGISINHRTRSEIAAVLEATQLCRTKRGSLDFYTKHFVLCIKLTHTVDVAEVDCDDEVFYRVWRARGNDCVVSESDLVVEPEIP